MMFSRPFSHESLREVRHDVQRRAERHGLTGVALYRFVVAVNEITTNAVQHGGGQGRLEMWTSGDRVHCRVTDQGPGLPPGYEIRPPSSRAQSGRGLWIASQGCDAFEVRRADGVTTVTLTGGPG